jgi:GT2 family glycosyltransferase
MSAGRIDFFDGKFIHGWAVGKNAHSPALITLREANGNTLNLQTANRHRSDLRSLETDLYVGGFLLEVPGDFSGGFLHLYSDNVELPGSPLEFADGEGDCLIQIKDGNIKGWVRERVSNGIDQDKIRVLLDGHSEIPISFNHSELSKSGQRRFHFSAFLANHWLANENLSISVWCGAKKLGETALSPSLIGHVDFVSTTRCAGWVFCHAAPDRTLVVQAVRDGRTVGAGSTHIERHDVAPHTQNRSRVGFDFRFNPPLRQDDSIALRLPGRDVSITNLMRPVDDIADKISALRDQAALALKNSDDCRTVTSVVKDAVSSYLATLQRRSVSDHVPGQENRAIRGRTQHELHSVVNSPKISVIIPVYKDIQVTKSCIDSVLKFRSIERDRIIIIHDASPEQGMNNFLSEYLDQSNIEIITNATNLGFIGAVNLGMRQAPAGHMVLLNSDTVLHSDIFSAFLKINETDHNIGTITPISNNATVFTYPHPALPVLKLEDITWSDVAKFLEKRNGYQTVRVPTGHGFCLFISDRARQFDVSFSSAFGRGYGEENELCERLSDRGLIHVAATGLFVEHIESVSFGAEKEKLIQENLAVLSGLYPYYNRHIEAFLGENPLRRFRWLLDLFRISRFNTKKIVISLENGLGGGSLHVANQIAQLAEGENFNVIRVRISPNGLQLSCMNPVIRADFNYEDLDEFFGFLGVLKPFRIITHQLLGAHLDLIHNFHRFSDLAPVIYMAHDYYFACPRVTLLKVGGKYCGLADTQMCSECLDVGGHHPTHSSPHITADAHRSNFAHVLASCSLIVSPSKTPSTLVRKFIEAHKIATKLITVPHFEEVSSDFVPSKAKRKNPYIVYLLGALGNEKGSRMLLELSRLAESRGSKIKFFVVGYTNRDEDFKNCSNVHITGPYNKMSLSDHLLNARGSIALFLSPWPETYSLTLSEALKFGLLPFAPNMGAFSDRISVRTGFLFDPNLDSLGILLKLEEAVQNIRRVANSKTSFREERTSQAYLESILLL